MWRGATESDGFNALVLRAGLTWRQTMVLRAYAKYLRQGGSTFSQTYIEECLSTNRDIARLLVRLFEARFDPEHVQDSADVADGLREEITAALDAVASLDQDRILRSLLGVIEATLRTNYFQTDADGKPKPFVSLKLDSAAGSRPATPAAEVRDLGLQPARRGRPPALRRGRARRAALVRPPRGLPHRGARPGEGADGQERRHRAGRRQGRLRRQAAAHTDR